MFTSLLVGLDGSREAQIALAQAILIGGRFRSTIVLAHVAQPGHASVLRDAPGNSWRERHPADLTTDEDEERIGRELLSDAAEAVRRGGLTAVMEYLEGDMVEALRGLAETVGVVLVGRSGRKGHGGTDPLGPDTRELLRRSPRPVLVCGAAPSPMDRCLVAYDGEASSEAALAFAARYASIAGAHLDVVHVADDPVAGSAVLARTSAAFSASPFSYETHLERGSVDEAVAAAVRRLHSNAVFTGIHRESGHRLVPSHTEAILRATDIPVLVHTQPSDPGARLSATHRRPAS